jgi:hypothetical protein
MPNKQMIASYFCMERKVRTLKAVVGNAHRLNSNIKSGPVPQRQYYPASRGKGEKCFEVFVLETKATKLSSWQQEACGKLYLVQGQIYSNWNKEK